MTEIRSKEDAQKRVDQILSFRQEMMQLAIVGALVLDEGQDAAVRRYHAAFLDDLARRYDVDCDKREKQFSLGMRIASFLGALGFGASLFFLFYQFWGYFPTTVQVGILFFTPLFFLAATAIMAFREKTGYFAKICAVLTLAAFVLNLYMYGQIFNMNSSNMAFLLWAVLGFLLAYAADARLLLALGIISFTGFLSAQMGTWSGCYWIHFGERPENFFPAAAISFLAAFLPHRKYYGFTVIYRVFGMIILFLPLLILSNWGGISYLPLSNSMIEIIYQGVGFFCAAFFIWLGLKRGWADVVNCGNVFFVIFLYTKFFDWWWDWMPKYIFFLIIGLTAVFFLLIFRRLRSSGAETKKEVPA